jgi:3-oxoacid CoA-transferase subunit A/glutaconate CoA-transferase subunit A
MDVVERGEGPLLAWHDPDEQRSWVQKNKTRKMIDKRMDMRTSVSKFVPDGSYIASGGFGHVRVSMAAVYEIIRQKKRRLILAGKTAVHDCDVLVGSGCIDQVEVAYSFGHELRGLSPASRRMVESGRVKAITEISNAGIQWRLRAAAMGLPFIPARVMLGTDTFKKSAGIVAKDPFSGKKIALLPACYPDVAMIHVHRCDMYGNCQIDGITVMDVELARAARRLIITTEELVDHEVIRNESWKTNIPFFCVDAVVEVRYGSHPGNMPRLYYSDEDHIAEWLKLSKTEEGTAQYLDKYVFGVKNFDEYLELVGGMAKMRRLEDIEHLRAPTKAPWAE